MKFRLEILFASRGVLASYAGSKSLDGVEIGLKESLCGISA